MSCLYYRCFRSFQQPPALRQVGFRLLQGGLPHGQLRGGCLEPLLVSLQMNKECACVSRSQMFFDFYFCFYF